MSNWMRRRIERSRARCDKAETNNKTDKGHEPEKQPRLAGAVPPESDAKGS